MKRHIAALSILAVAGGVGWKLSSRPATTARLSDVSLDQRSEHSHPGPTSLAGIRIRIMADDVHQISATADRVPQVALTGE